MSEVLISFFVAQKLLLKWIISQVPIWKLEKSSASESASKRVSAGGPPFEARFAILSSSLKPLPLSKSPNKEREEPVSQVKWNLDALDAPLETKKWKVFRMTMFRFKTWRSLRQKCDRHQHRHRHRRQQRRRQRWTRSATFFVISVQTKTTNLFCQLFFHRTETSKQNAPILFSPEIEAPDRWVRLHPEQGWRKPQPEEPEVPAQQERHRLQDHFAWRQRLVYRRSRKSLCRCLMPLWI